MEMPVKHLASGKNHRLVIVTVKQNTHGGVFFCRRLPFFFSSGGITSKLYFFPLANSGNENFFQLPMSHDWLPSFA